jgi:hypothetical protein
MNLRISYREGGYIHRYVLSLQWAAFSPGVDERQKENKTERHSRLGYSVGGVQDPGTVVRKSSLRMGSGRLAGK